MASVDEDPKRLVEMYTRLLEERGETTLAPTADYPDFMARYSYPPISIAFYWMAHGEVLATVNRVNAFWRHIHSLAAWNIILPSLNEDDRYNAIFEFVRPTADQCLTAPYSIKSMLTTSVCHLSHHTRLFSEKNFNVQLKDDRYLDYNEA